MQRLRLSFSRTLFGPAPLRQIVRSVPHMKKRLIVAFVLLVVILLSIASLTFYGRGNPVQVAGQLSPQDVATIRRDYQRLQRQKVSQTLASADPLFLLSSLREVAFGRVREVGSPLPGYAVVRTGYVWSSNTVWVCDLVRGSNGWRLP